MNSTKTELDSSSKTFDDSFDSFRKLELDDEKDFFLVRQTKTSPGGFFGDASYSNPLFFTMAIVFCVLGVVC